MVGALPAEDRGAAGALAEMSRSMGNVVSASVLFEVFRAGAAADGFLAGFTATYMTAAAIPFGLLVVGGAVLAIRRGRL